MDLHLSGAKKTACPLAVVRYVEIRGDHVAALFDESANDGRSDESEGAGDEDRIGGHGSPATSGRSAIGSPPGQVSPPDVTPTHSREGSGLTGHLGNPVPSPALFNKIGNRLRKAVHDFAEEHEVAILKLEKPDRAHCDDGKLDHVRDRVALKDTPAPGTPGARAGRRRPTNDRRHGPRRRPGGYGAVEPGKPTGRGT